MDTPKNQDNSEDSTTDDTSWPEADNNNLEDNTFAITKGDENPPKNQK